MIIENERDARVAAWVRAEASADDIAQAVQKLASRAWPGKVAWKLGLKVPLEVTDPDSAARGLAAFMELKKLQAELKARIEADGQSKNS